MTRDSGFTLMRGTRKKGKVNQRAAVRSRSISIAALPLLEDNVQPELDQPPVDGGQPDHGHLRGARFTKTRCRELRTWPGSLNWMWLKTTRTCVFGHFDLFFIAAESPGTQHDAGARIAEAGSRPTAAQPGFPKGTTGAAQGAARLKRPSSRSTSHYAQMRVVTPAPYSAFERHPTDAGGFRRLRGQ